MDSHAQIQKCLNCRHPECIDCISSTAVTVPRAVQVQRRYDLVVKHAKVCSNVEYVIEKTKLSKSTCQKYINRGIAEGRIHAS